MMKLKMVKRGWSTRLQVAAFRAHDSASVWSVKPYQNEPSQRAHSDMTHVLVIEKHRICPHGEGRQREFLTSAGAPLGRPKC
jgi:hypothetical protein